TPPSPSRIRPPEMVLATSVLRNAPTRLSTAANATATFGLMAPVAMGVAIALAVSWKPLVKSKNRASAMTSATRIRGSTAGNQNMPPHLGQLVGGALPAQAPPLSP